MIRRVDSLISLPATDIPRAVAFYTDALGLETVFASAQTGFHIFRAPEGEVTLGVHRHEGPLPAPDPHGVWVWLQVHDIETERERLTSRGVRFLGETVYIGPGHETTLADSEGNVLRLYAPLQEVRRTVRIEASPRAVFAALTDARAMAAWFTALQHIHLDARAGGRVAFVDPLFGEVEGRVVAVEAERRIAFEFTQNWPTNLDVTLTPDGAATRVEVWQRGFDPIRDRDFNIGRLVANLEQALESLGRHAVP